MYDFHKGVVAHLNTPQELINSIPLFKYLSLLNNTLGTDKCKIYVIPNKVINIKCDRCDYKTIFHYLNPFKRLTKVSDSWVEIKYDAKDLAVIISPSAVSYLDLDPESLAKVMDNYKKAQVSIISNDKINNLLTICIECEKLIELVQTTTNEFFKDDKAK